MVKKLPDPVENSSELNFFGPDQKKIISGQKFHKSCQFFHRSAKKVEKYSHQKKRIKFVKSFLNFFIPSEFLKKTFHSRILVTTFVLCKNLQQEREYVRSKL